MDRDSFEKRWCIDRTSTCLLTTRSIYTLSLTAIHPSKKTPNTEELSGNWNQARNSRGVISDRKYTRTRGHQKFLRDVHRSYCCVCVCACALEDPSSLQTWHNGTIEGRKSWVCWLCPIKSVSHPLTPKPLSSLPLYSILPSPMHLCHTTAVYPECTRSNSTVWAP